MKEVRRGELYMAILEKQIGSEQYGERPVLIIQNNHDNRHSPTTIVLPVSSRTSKTRPTHAWIKDLKILPRESLVLAEQIRVIDKSRLGRFLGKADGETMKGINRALRTSLGLTGFYRNRTLDGNNRPK